MDVQTETQTDVTTGTAEPTFVLRGQDISAPLVIDFWILVQQKIREHMDFGMTMTEAVKAVRAFYFLDRDLNVSATDRKLAGACAIAGGDGSLDQSEAGRLMTTVHFQVLGIAQPKGSTKAFMRPGMKYPVITNDNTKTKPWAESIKLVAQQHAPTGGPWTGTVYLILSFSLVRPKSLPRRVLHHLKKPDLDKLVRAVKDALKGVMYVDDSQVVDLHATKVYATEDFPPGVLVTMTHKGES